MYNGEIVIRTDKIYHQNDTMLLGETYKIKPQDNVFGGKPYYNLQYIGSNTKKRDKHFIVSRNKIRRLYNDNAIKRLSF